MHIHHPVYPGEVRTPDLFQKPFPGEDHSGMLGEGKEEVKLQPGKGKRLLGKVDRPLLGPDDQVLKAKLLLKPAPPQKGPDPGHHLPWAKGLDHIVIRKLQAP